LGIANIQYGLVLTGSEMNEQVIANTEATKEVAGGDKQVVAMRIDGFSYIPNRFTVKQGIPVEWRIDAAEAASCGRFLLAPSLGIRKILSDKTPTVISFVPQQAGEFAFNCGMGMMTP